MSTQLVRQFTQVCTLCTFLAKQGKQCEASKLGAPLRELAVFKYLMPEDSSFQYEETVFDPVFGKAPERVLVFYFPDKKARQRTIQEMQQMIKDRTQQFRQALARYLAKDAQTLAELFAVAESFVPEKGQPVNDLHTRSNTIIKAEGSYQSLIVKKAMFDELKDSLSEVVSSFTEPAREARFGPCPPELERYVCDHTQLYTHQSAALALLLARSTPHLMVSTSTASGKSLIFKTIVRYALDQSPDACALFIYPTKALAHDQLQSFHFPAACAFDGDVPKEQRNSIRDRARVLFVNPDILHTTILPNWRDWIRVLENLRYVIVDEVHYYGGVFGANVAMVMRRLRRICNQIGAEPRFIGCSATVENPVQMLSQIIGVPASEVACLGPEQDGSPTGQKKFIFCTPEKLAKGSIINSGRYHPIREAAPLLVKMVNKNLRVIAFCRYRRECELLLRAVYELEPLMGPKSGHGSDDPSGQAKVMGYRGGYSADDRRVIEKRMFEGDLRGIVATSALEVGIDIGNLDAAIIVGFPYSIASFRQQVGRVGRRSNESYVVYVADGSVLDQAHAHNIEGVLHGKLETIPIALHDSIVRGHLQTAAYEQPLDEDDLRFFPEVDPISSNLTKLDDGMWTFPHQPEINIRKSEEEEETLVVNEQNKIIERIERERVGFTLYEGAIFVHQGVPYLVTNLEENLLYAKVRRTSVKWTTRQRDLTDVDPVSRASSKDIFFSSHDLRMLSTEAIMSEEGNALERMRKSVNEETAYNEFKNEERESEEAASNRKLLKDAGPPLAFAANVGKVKVTTVVFGYFKFNRMNQIIDQCEVSIPPIIKYRKGLWINIPSGVLAALNQYGYHIPGAIHGAEHLLMSTLPILIAMSPGDVSTECKAPEKEFSTKQTSRQRPARLVFYENYSDSEGSGILQTAYNVVGSVIARACAIVDACPCELGCYSCVAYSKCTEHNAVISKRGAQLIIRAICGKPYDDLPPGPEPNLKHGTLINVVSVEANAVG